ncbi:hypothetical protein PVAP13_3NG130022 [Panicum virgatum]|uniref:Uncharacterized protein n=1 Tax=Panicum virgatum TaxID=38727 RepID=A0A8T0TZF4_PANVG|nr:hypothetical protein PVAP13_3NG130022 [Panicum virgatum]
MMHGTRRQAPSHGVVPRFSSTPPDMAPATPGSPDLVTAWSGRLDLTSAPSLLHHGCGLLPSRGREAGSSARYFSSQRGWPAPTPLSVDAAEEGACGGALPDLMVARG